MRTLEEIRKLKTELRSKLETVSGEELDKTIKEIEELDAEQKDVEKRSKILASFASNPDDVQSRAIEKQVSTTSQKEYGIDSAEYRSAFFKKLIEMPLNEVEQRALTTNVSSGGAAIPTTTMNKILEKIENNSVVYNLVQVEHLKGAVTIPIEGTTNDVERKAEGATASDANDTLGSLKLGAKKYIKLIKLTCELENQAIDALENYIVSKLSKKLLQAFDYDIINGNGTNGAKGILATITPENVETAGTLKYDDICDLFAMIPAIARKNATLLMSTNTLYKQVKKIKDDEGKPIFNPDLNKVLGRDVVECDDVPDGTIIFGDFKEYVFNWNKEAEITKSTENGFASGDTYFRILALADGGLADLGAMAAITVGTATSGT